MSSDRGSDRDEDLPVGFGVLGGHWRRWRRALLGKCFVLSFVYLLETVSALKYLVYSKPFLVKIMISLFQECSNGSVLNSYSGNSYKSDECDLNGILGIHSICGGCGSIDIENSLSENATKRDILLNSCD